MNRFCKKAVFSLLLLALGGVFGSLPAQAFWDYQLGFSGRSVPFGGIMNATVGYNWRFWGEDPLPSLPASGPSEGPAVWQYGFLRPSLSLQTIGLNNRAIAELDIFPVSIVGITLGQSYRYRLAQSFQFDCTQISCGGMLSRSYLRGQLVAGASNFFAVFTGKYELLSQPGGVIPFVEENNNLLGIPGKDQMISLSGGLGYSITSRWQVGVASLYSRLIGTGNDSVNHFAYVNHYRDRWSFVLGAGSFSSSLQELSPTIVGMIQLTGQRPLGLF